jgi:hypothetical protein
VWKLKYEKLLKKNNFKNVSCIIYLRSELCFPMLKKLSMFSSTFEVLQEVACGEENYRPPAANSKNNFEFMLQNNNNQFNKNQISIVFFARNVSCYIMEHYTYESLALDSKVILY